MAKRALLPDERRRLAEALVIHGVEHVADYSLATADAVKLAARGERVDERVATRIDRACARLARQTTLA